MYSRTIHSTWQLKCSHINYYPHIWKEIYGLGRRWLLLNSIKGIQINWLSQYEDNSHYTIYHFLYILQPQQPEEEATHFDRVAMYSNQKLYKLLQGIPEYLAGRKVMSAFVIQIGRWKITVTTSEEKISTRVKFH